ncbi:sensor histidine kinase [Histidinibacterium aquaticum]|nr:sensor histidine kinase [Histidinibacterium aquaticum]
MQAILEYASYMPHGYCLFWQPWLVILFVGSDFLIFASYSAIPIALWSFLRQRQDIRYRGLVALFSAFILLCGITHLVSMLTLWVPMYPLHGVTKLITGIVSAATAVMLFRLIPELVRIPAPSELERVNAELRKEVEAHEKTFALLREAQRDLEEKVEARTAELEELNGRMAVAAREAVHRSKNLLSVVTSIARQTARGAVSKDDFVQSFIGRIDALASATSSVIRGDGARSADIGDIVRSQLEPALLTYGDRIAVEGPPVAVGQQGAQQLGLLLHELATNAQKFGALAGEEGSIDVRWDLREWATGDPALNFTWREAGPGGSEASLPDQDAGGFGSKLLTTVVPGMLSGSATRRLEQGYLVYELTVPLSAIEPDTEAKEAGVAEASRLTEREYGVPTAARVPL